MSIFTKPINEITYEDVISFCQQEIGEGINLDYKKDFPPSGLEKTISAFANSFGGIILIGIEDQDSKPNPPFDGIDYKDKLEERIWNIIVDNIYPPLFPEIRICPPKNGKTFVIIRIPQSNETPHAIYNNTNVYIRTGNRNKPEELATIEQIDWLKNRRRKSEELREILYRRAEERYENICEAKKVRIECGEFTLSFAPLYPQKPLILKLNEIENIVQDIMVRNNLNRKFPLLHNELKPAQDGMIHFFLNEGNGFITYTEINRFGLVFYKEDLGFTKTENPNSEPEKITYMDDLMQILDVSFEALGRFYNRIGYWGLIEVNFSLKRLLGIKFIPLIPRNAIFFRNDIEKNEIEKQLSWKFETSVAALNDPTARQNKLLESGKEIAWSFGFKVNEETIIQQFKERQRWVGNKNSTNL